MTVDRSTANWSGDVGVVTSLLPRLAFDPENCVAMVCGPEIMMKVVARDLVPLGVDRDRIFMSMERNMKCAVGFCGHCQFGAELVCRDGPVFSFNEIAGRLRFAEL